MTFMGLTGGPAMLARKLSKAQRGFFETRTGRDLLAKMLRAVRMREGREVARQFASVVAVIRATP